MDSSPAWPDLDYDHWRETALTLQLWTQMAGKVRLAHEPWLNHGWHVPLYVSAHGLSTSIIHGDLSGFEIEFDFVEDVLRLRSSDGSDAAFALEPMTVAEFYRRFTAALRSIDVNDRFHRVPNEVSDPVPFPEDELHRSYDRDAVHAWWRALLSIDRVFKHFRTGFLGKASPVHLFWGSFDLAVTRFSGRSAPLHPGGIPGLPDAVTREAYDHELSSAGFWPGDARFPHAAFYSYAYPTPSGFSGARVQPAQAFFSRDLGEWLLPYADVRAAADPGATLLRFLQSTFEAAARLCGWGENLQCSLGTAGIPRRTGT